MGAWRCRRGAARRRPDPAPCKARAMAAVSVRPGPARADLSTPGDPRESEGVGKSDLAFRLHRGGLRRTRSLAGRGPASPAGAFPSGSLEGGAPAVVTRARVHSDPEAPRLAKRTIRSCRAGPRAGDVSRFFAGWAVA